MFIFAWAAATFHPRICCDGYSAIMAAALEKQVDVVAVKLGYQLHKEQKGAILSFISGKDTFVALPTGYGKSLIYGCLPLVYDSIEDCRQAQA